MIIHEYQAKKIFSKFELPVPNGYIAYTPNEAQSVALKISETGPWVVKAQILAGSRDEGKFTDKRAGKKGGIRLSKTLQDVRENADEMLKNNLITEQTSQKGRFVSRVYIEEFVKTFKKFYFGLIIDRISASVILLVASVSEKDEDNIIKIVVEKSSEILKLNLGLEKNIKSQQVRNIIDFMGLDIHIDEKELKSFLNKMLKIFYTYNATMLEINPVGINRNGNFCALDAKIIFDKNALYRHPDILKILYDGESEEREKIARKNSFQYKELENGIGIIVNGDGLALSTINDAKRLDLNTACFLNLKGSVEREKIAEGIKLIMTNPRVDGILINILGGFLRCNLIADGIINVANDLGLNIPLVVRFEGTNKNEAIDILKKSNLSLLIAENTDEGLQMLKKAIEEDL